MPLVDELKLQMDMAEIPEVRITLVGAHDAVRPVTGLTDVNRLRDPANPFKLVSVTVDVPDEPAGNVTIDGLAATLKSGGAITLTLMVTVCDNEPLVPATVTV